MTQSQMIALVRKLIADEQATGFTEGGNLEEPEGTQELINYLDRACDALSQRLAGARDLRLLKRMTVANGAKLPDDFLFFAGNVPVSVENGLMNFYGEATTLPIRYFARLPYVSAYPTGNLPYQHNDEIVIAALAATYALNKHEFNVSQDLMLLGMGGAANAVAGGVGQ